MKPIIGIMAHLAREGKSPLGQSNLGNTYVVSIAKAGGIPIILPTVTEAENMDALVEKCDGFLFSGGIDVSPIFYGEEGHPKLGLTCWSLDQVQISLMKKVLEARKPVLGICRGHQVLNVAAGGSLYQDLSEHDGTCIKHFQETDVKDVTHRVFIEPDSILGDLFDTSVYTNSFHHQAVKDPGKGVRVIARSSDDIVEAIQLEDYPYGLGIQWHPEAMFAHGDESMRPLFESFVRACS